MITARTTAPIISACLGDIPTCIDLVWTILTSFFAGSLEDLASPTLLFVALWWGRYVTTTQVGIRKSQNRLESHRSF